MDDLVDVSDADPMQNAVSCKSVPYFDFEKFCLNMQKCILEETDDIELESYLIAYDELYNFFVILGGAFQFVAMDVKKKIKILQEFQANDSKNSGKMNNFLTVKTMVRYEKEENLLQNPKYVSGSRTLLRLHRGFDFITKFLKHIYDLEDEAKLGPIARDVYDETLAPHHTWIVKSSARVAMQLLPIRTDLLNKICMNDGEKRKTLLEKFPDALEKANNVYGKIQNIYKENELLELP